MVNWCWAKEQRQYNGGKVAFQQMMLEELDDYMQKMKSRYRAYTLNENEFEMGHGPKCKIQNYKILADNIWKQSRW